jgi:hypothetical protein
MNIQFPSYLPVVTYIRNWYARFERPLSSLSLVGGFVFDAVTLTRVDRLWDNIWIGAHLVIVALCIVLINRAENKGADPIHDPKDPAKLHFWLVNILQFFFGGLLSTYLVFYFRSAVITVAWPFLLILVIAFIANESLKRHYARLYFQIAFLFFCIFLFATFIVPVIVHRIGPDVFLLSGGVSLLLIILFVLILRYVSREVFAKNILFLAASIVIVYAGINVLYFSNLIPPLPLSLQDAGVYHRITRTSDGNYTVLSEDSGALGKILTYFGEYQTYHLVAGESASVFTAIFSPAALNTTIIHKWQYLDTSKNTWLTISTVPLSVVGGRDGGYRTYSVKNGLTPGKWRVVVETESGQLIGRLVFNVAAVDVTPLLQTSIKE